MDLDQEKGASTWLTSLPIQEFRFSLHKGAFQDPLMLCLYWQLHRAPPMCACGKIFWIDHVLSCPKGGFSDPKAQRNKGH